MVYQKVTHVIFDMDGLLIDSETVYDQIMTDIAQSFGKSYPDELKLKILGTPEQDTARIAVAELQLPMTPDEFLDQYHVKVAEGLKNPNIMPGVEALIKHLHRHKIPIAVATSSSQRAMEIKTKNHQPLFELFDHMVCGSTDPEVKNGKPAPDIFLVCASRFPDKPDPKTCLVFEDAPNGIVGASEAGMQTVMVPHPFVPDELRKMATLVLNSVKEFEPELFGLPAFSN